MIIGVVIIIILVLCVAVIVDNLKSTDSISKSSDAGWGSSSFSIEGKWQSVGDTGFGQAQPGAVVYFDGVNCNIVSPFDTYTVKGSNGSYTLDVTSFSSTAVFTFDINLDGKNHIYLIGNSSTIELERVN